jgi:alkyldihydroxyacetonephosphate synthase
VSSTESHGGGGRWSAVKHALPPRTQAFLLAQLGPGDPPRRTEPTVLSSPPLPDEALRELQRMDIDVSADIADRVARSLGMSYLDVLRHRQGVVLPGPAVVIRPSEAAQVQRVLDWAQTHNVVVVPRGGGTSVVGGLTGATDGRAWVSLDMRGLRSIVDLDEVSHLVRVQPGITGPELEEHLAARGLRLGHLPQSWERATIGGYASTRSAGQESTGVGRFEELVQHVHFATPSGPWAVGHVPATAAGPDLLRYVLGAEGTLGVITEVQMRVRPLPRAHHGEGAMAPDWSSAVAALRTLIQFNLAPDVVRLSDNSETKATWSMSAPTGVLGSLVNAYLGIRGARQGCLLILHWNESSAAVLRARRRAAWKILRHRGVVGLGAAVGRSWVKHRFAGPYLRDDLMDGGYFVETFETATSWANIDRLHGNVIRKVREVLPECYVMSHISHVYPTGASLYFTAIATAHHGEHWRQAKGHITDAIVAAGGTVSHHHGVGADHAPWLAGEVGDVGLAALRAVKHRIDPLNVMNPGVLPPEEM